MIKEFYNIDNYKEKEFSSISVLEKELKKNNMDISRNKENKIDFRKSNNLSSLEAQNSIEFNFNSSLNPRQNLVESLKSNIFNDKVNYRTNLEKSL